MLLTIDPSTDGRRTGWAVLDDNGGLVACGKDSPPAELVGRVTRAVLEVPRVYPNGRTANPNDIVALAVKVGELAGVLMANGVDVRYVEPRAWKGTVDASACCRRVWRRLDERERSVAAPYEPEAEGEVRGGKDHVLDAIGIGLNACGRWRVG